LWVKADQTGVALSRSGIDAAEEKFLGPWYLKEGRDFPLVIPRRSDC
jgi:hypothetical protein